MDVALLLKKAYCEKTWTLKVSNVCNVQIPWKLGADNLGGYFLTYQAALWCTLTQLKAQNCPWSNHWIIARTVT